MGLLGFLGRCLRGRDRERNIFTFWDGRSWFGFRRLRYIDPFETYSALLDHPDFSVSELSSLGNPTDTDTQLKWRLQSVSKLAKCVRDVFRVQPLSEGGLTNEECIQLLNRFFQWSGVVKKNGVQPHNSQQSAEPTQDATRDDLESGLTETTSESSGPSGQPEEQSGAETAKSD